MSIAALICVVLAGCTPTPTPAPTPTPTLTPIPTSTLTPTPTPVPINVGLIAEEIAADVGQVGAVVEPLSDKAVFVFEETHDSPAGQLEIAIMLNRLYEDHGLHAIGLEGAMASEGPLDGSWFHTPPPFEARDPIGAREDVIVQMVEQGEISAAEMMALTYVDAEVMGIENRDEYDVGLSDEAAAAGTIYLYLIALPGMTDSEIEEIIDLIDQEKILEAVEFAISTDPFTDRIYQRIQDETTIVCAEEWLEILDEIESKADRVGAETEADDEANMGDLRRFFRTAVQRNQTMVDYVLELAESHPNEPVAMVTGAAHTCGVVDLLTEAQVSFAVLQPNSLSEGLEAGSLTLEAYDRKLAIRSVDPPGSLGALLDERRKPEPVIHEMWFQVKSRVFEIVTEATRAIHVGHSIDDLPGLLPTFANVTFQPIEVENGQLIFQIDTVKDSGDPITLYGRSAIDEDPDGIGGRRRELEERLFEGLERVRAKAPPGPEPESEPDIPPVIRLSSDTIAACTDDLLLIIDPI